MPGPIRSIRKDHLPRSCPLPALLLAFALLLPGPARAAPPPVQEVRGICYPSGLRLLVLHREGPPLVAVATVVDGGSSAEGPGEEGAAHLIEHLWFRSPRLGYPTVDDLLNSIGAEANAYTTHDETQYITVAHRRTIRSLLTTTAERLLDPLGAIDAAALETERRVVQNEIAERYEGRDPALAAILRGLVPGEHPYGRTVPGSSAQVAALDREALERYAARQYTPAHTSITIAGDIGTDQVLRLVQSIFDPSLLEHPEVGGVSSPGPCPDRTDPADDDPVLPASAPWETVDAGVDEPVAGIAWALPADPASRVRARTAAWLMTIQLDEGSPLDAACWTEPLRRMTVLMCTAPDPARRGEETWRRGLKAVDRLWRQALDAQDSRSLYWGQMARLLARWEGGDRAAQREVLATTGFVPEQSLRFHRRGTTRPSPPVTAAEAARFARRWLVPERMRGRVLVPAEARRTASASFHGGRGQRTTPPEPVGPVDAARLAEVVVDPGLNRIDARLVANRPVWVLGREGVQAVRISAVYPGDEGWSDELLRSRAWDLVEDPWDLMARRTRIAANTYDVRMQLLDQERWWSFRARGFDPLLTAQVLRRTVPPPFGMIPKAEDQAMAEELEAWRVEAQGNAHWEAEHLRWRALADGLPHPLLDPDAFAARQAIPRREAGDFLATYLHPRRARIVAVTPPDQVEATHLAIQQQFGVAVEAGDVDLEPAPNRAAAPRRIAVIAVDDPGPQARITAACHVAHGDGVHRWVLERVLDEALNDALRNDLGITYGVYTDFHWTAHGQVLQVDTRVPHDTAGPATAEILGAIQRAAEGALSPDTVARYTLEVARSTALRWQSADELLDLLEASAASGLAPEDLDLARRLAEVDPEVLAARLQPCAGYEAVTLIGDPARIGPSLDDAGLAWSRWEP